MDEKTYRKNKDWWSEKISSKLSGEPHVGTFMELLEEDEDHNIKLSKLTTYDYWHFQSNNHAGRHPSPFMSSIVTSLKSLNDIFPIEHIEKIDSSHICVIYKLELERSKDIYTYMIFESCERLTDENTPYECWDYTGEIYFIESSLSLKKFKSIEVGDTAEDVYKIDNGIIYDFVFGFTYPNLSYRLLTDGIMIITFETDDSPESEEGFSRNDLSKKENLKHFIVSDITFYPYDGDKIPTMPTLSSQRSLVAFSRPDLTTVGR